MNRLLLAALCMPALWACARVEPDPSQTALAPMNPRTPAEAPQRHVLATVEVGSGSIRVLEARTVDAPMPIDRAPDRAPWRVRVEDASGAALYVGAVEAAGTWRGEFAGPDGNIEDVHLARDPAVVALRTPVLAGARTIRLFARPESVPGDAREKPAAPGAMVELGHAAWPEPSP